MLKKIPNLLSCLRILLSMALLFCPPLSGSFYGVYILCGLSDALDGWIARRTNSTSSFGARLDSLADLVMTAVLLMVLLPLIKLTTGVLLWIAAIALLRLISVLTAYRKYGCFAMLHTYLNKATGLGLFVLPLLLPLVRMELLIDILCAMASVSALEELLIQMTSKELNLNSKGIWTR